MENTPAQSDLFNIQMGLSATPDITFIKPGNKAQPAAGLAALPQAGGFSVSMEAALPYEALAGVLNGYLVGKRFELSKGFIKKHLVVQHCNIAYSKAYGKLVAAVDFSGSYQGTLYFTSTAALDASKQKIVLQDFNYNLETNDFLLKAARWLFDKQIVAEISKHLVVDLTRHYATVARTIGSWINKEWSKEVTASGEVTEVKLTDVHAREQHLLLLFSCSGSLSLRIMEEQLQLKP